MTHVGVSWAELFPPLYKQVSCRRNTFVTKELKEKKSKTAPHLKYSRPFYTMLQNKTDEQTPWLL